MLQPLSSVMGIHSRWRAPCFRRIVSNRDINIDSYKPAEMPAYPGENNHGSIARINGEMFGRNFLQKP